MKNNVLFRRDTTTVSENKPSLSEHSPFISICMPTYNRAKYIKEAIESAIDQDYNNFEIIVLDDGSTDNTEEIVKGIGNYSQIRYIKKDNEGIPITRNKLIDLAKGDYILWLDSDDKLFPNVLKVYAEYTERFKDVSVFYGNLKPFGNIPYSLKEMIYVDVYRRNHELLAHFVYGNVLPNPGSMVKKSVYDYFGNYNIEFTRAQDTEFWSRILDKVFFKNINTFSVYYRFHENNISGNVFSGKCDLSFNSRILTAMLKRYPLERLFPQFQWKLHQQAMADAYLEIGWIYGKWGDIDRSMDYYQKSINSLSIDQSPSSSYLDKENLKQAIKDEKLLDKHVIMINKNLEKYGLSG